MEKIKRISVVILVLLITIACKEDVKISENLEEVDPVTKLKDSLYTAYINEKAAKKTYAQIKAELKSKGFKTYDYIDKETQDTLLVQQYFIAFIKPGIIRGQNEEESIELQNQHLEYLESMYKQGHADLSGLFVDDSDYLGITIYNVPNKKAAQRLVNADPMVKEMRLEVEIFPWWAVKGRVLR